MIIQELRGCTCANLWDGVAQRRCDQETKSLRAHINFDDMRYHSAGSSAFVAIIRHALEDVLRDRSRSLPNVGQEGCGCPGRPPIHAADADPVLICIGAQALQRLHPCSDAHCLEGGSRSFTHIQSACDAVPIPGNFIRRWSIGSGGGVGGTRTKYLAEDQPVNPSLRRICLQVPSGLTPMAVTTSLNSIKPSEANCVPGPSRT